jgi:orotidine-5'-phosphate decarboxylase
MKEKIIIALDVEKFVDAKRLVIQLPDAEIFKVGLQAFLKFGEKIISLLKNYRKKIFLDLKFKDIPNTVYGAVQSCLDYTPFFLTIHLSGGADMIKKSIEASCHKSNLTILGVTILTSLSDRDLNETGISLSGENAVLKLCELGIKNNIKGLVCSPQEIEPIRKRFGNDIILVTPGIRPIWSATGDQKRVFPPKLAMEKGSNYLVIGRPITQSENPAAAFQKILEEMLT